MKFMVKGLGETHSGKVKEMIDAIKTELEIQVPRVKIIRVRKLALQGIADSL